MIGPGGSIKFIGDAKGAMAHEAWRAYTTATSAVVGLDNAPDSYA